MNSIGNLPDIPFNKIMLHLSLKELLAIKVVPKEFWYRWIKQFSSDKYTTIKKRLEPHRNIWRHLYPNEIVRILADSNFHENDIQFMLKYAGKQWWKQLDTKEIYNIMKKFKFHPYLIYFMDRSGINVLDVYLKEKISSNQTDFTDYEICAFAPYDDNTSNVLEHGSSGENTLLRYFIKKNMKKNIYTLITCPNANLTALKALSKSQLTELYNQRDRELTITYENERMPFIDYIDFV